MAAMTATRRFGGHCRQALVPSLRPAIFDVYILTVDKPAFFGTCMRNAPSYRLSPRRRSSEFSFDKPIEPKIVATGRRRQPQGERRLADTVLKSLPEVPTI
jgi:hypothetical protein